MPAETGTRISVLFADGLNLFEGFFAFCTGLFYKVSIERFHGFFEWRKIRMGHGDTLFFKESD